MIPKGMALGVDAADNFRMLLHIFATDKESGVDSVRVEDIEDLPGVGR